jgi:hypothetical protein
MQHLAVRSDRKPPVWAKDKYVLKLDMQCPVCKSVTYQLWAPVLETEKEAVEGQMGWLASYLPKACIGKPDAHPDWFLTIDRPD